MDLQWLIDIDHSILYACNGSNSLFFDGIMATITSGYTWIPLYMALFFLIVRNNDNMSEIMLIFLSSAVCLLLSEGMADGVFKPLVARFRPTYDPMICDNINTVDGITGSQPYGFISAHAANTFGIALLFCFIVKSKLLSVTLMFWSLINCYSRIYLGVHYPGDVICGMIWGTVSAVIAFLVYKRVYKRLSESSNNYISTQYTSSGYSAEDIDIVVAVFTFTLFYVIINGCFFN